MQELILISCIHVFPTFFVFFFKAIPYDSLLDKKMNDIYTKQIIRKRCRSACYIRIALTGSEIFCFLLLHLLIIKIKLWILDQYGTRILLLFMLTKFTVSLFILSILCIYHIDALYVQ